MSKLLTLSLVALFAISTSLPLTISLAQAAGPSCSTDHRCPPVIPKDPGNPGDPGDPGEPNNPGSPGDPYIPPDFVTADVTQNMLIACRVSGTPDGLPNDLRFRNIGDITIPAGTRVYWIVKESGDHGYFVLPADLPVGESVNDLDVLLAGLPTTDHCYSKIM